MTLSQKILAAVECSPIPISTPDLIAVVIEPGTSYPRGRVWVQLRYLERSHLIARTRGVRLDPHGRGRAVRWEKHS